MNALKLPNARDCSLNSSLNSNLFDRSDSVWIGQLGKFSTNFVDVYSGDNGDEPEHFMQRLKIEVFARYQLTIDQQIRTGSAVGFARPSRLTLPQMQV